MTPVSIPNAAAVTALGQSSNATSSITISSANGNAQTILRSVLTVNTAALGTASGRVKNTVDNLATLTFNANSAGAVALNNITLTFNGSAINATSDLGISLFDTNNNDVTIADGATSLTTSCAVGTCVKKWTFGANGFQISAGSSYSFNLRFNTIANTNVAGSNSSVSLAVAIQNSNDVQYADGLDSAAISGLTLPANVIPLNITSVTFSSGT
jgi:hypothetical protein